MPSDHEPDALWRLTHDEGAGRVRRAIARLVWLYAAAPLRELLVGPEGAYLVDGLFVLAARGAVLPRSAVTAAAPPEPIASGWRGNLLFLAVWLFVIGGIAAAARWVWPAG